MKPKPIIICDANILIDYINSNMAILSLASEHCYEIYAPHEVIKEATKKTPSLKLDALGVKTCDVEWGQIAEADELAGSCSLSLQDSLCFIVARDKKWICATNEKTLRNKCRREKVETFRGLRFMLDLVIAGKLNKEAAHTTAQKISETNATITQEIINDFIKMLNSIS